MTLLIQIKQEKFVPFTRQTSPSNFSNILPNKVHEKFMKSEYVSLQGQSRNQTKLNNTFMKNALKQRIRQTLAKIGTTQQTDVTFVDKNIIESKASKDIKEIN